MTETAALSDTFWREFYAANRPFALRSAVVLLGSVDRAEDAVHECFLRLPKIWARRRPTTPERAFLYGVLRNVCREIIRGEVRLRRAQERGERGEIPLRQEGAENDARAARLSRALERLAPKFREPVLLHYYERMDLESIAGVLGLPVGTVKSRLHKARERLASLLSSPTEG